MRSRIDVPPERDLPAGRLAQRRAHLITELTRDGGAQRPVRGSRRRRWPVMVLAPAAALVLGAAAYALVAHSPEEVVTGIGCFEAADTGANTAVVSADGRHPVTVCRDLWEQGAISGVSESPQLVACVPEQGQVVWVFPGGKGTCEKLGLGPLPFGYEEAASAFAQMERELLNRFSEQSCVGEDQARTIAREVLDDHGFEDWTIREGAGEGSGFSPSRPCAGLAFDAEGRTVILVPEEEPGG